jgi:uncharacterized protein YjbJ (UPF0337 family)
MTDSTDDRIEGGFDQAKGRAKDALGGLTGDEQTQAEGKMDQAKGGLREKLADAKDKIDDFRDGDDTNRDRA